MALTEAYMFKGKFILFFIIINYFGYNILLFIILANTRIQLLPMFYKYIKDYFKKTKIYCFILN
jgi:hypothetical protein